MHHQDRNIHTQGFTCAPAKIKRDTVDGLRIMWVAAKITIGIMVAATIAHWFI